MTTPSIRLASCTFSDGTRIELGRSDIVVIVGANNSGKSEALRNIGQEFGRPSGNQSTPIVVKTVQVVVEGDPADAEAWIKENFTIKNGTLMHAGINFHFGNAKAEWVSRAAKTFGHLFCSNVSVENRLTSVKSIPGFDPLNDAPNHPAHKLMGNFALEQRVSEWFHEAFGLDLVLYPFGSSRINLHVGQRPALENGLDGLSQYAEKVNKLPPLAKQGDGMRCFAALILQVLLENYVTYLVDEPEAFLHPPQARLLGKLFARDLPQDRQLIISTHSSDIIKGLLSSDKGRVRILRIQRKENVNHVAELSNTSVRELWGHPLLRASNILDGLFHSRVVVCESDGDVRFYGAISDALYDESSEVLFVHCNGKDRVEVAAKALKGMKVPISVVADFDLLNEERNIERIVKSLGGDWSVFKPDWQVVYQAISQKRAELLTADVRREITQALDGCTTESLSKKGAETIRGVLKRATPWEYAKSLGLRFLPNGDVRTKCVTLLSHLQELGLYIVPIGELESFVPTIGSGGTDKSSWLAKAMERDLLADAELANARSFVASLVKGAPIDQALLVG